MKRPTRKQVYVLAIVLCWIGVASVWWLRREVSLTDHAKTVIEAVYDADGRTLMKYAFEEEIRANDLTPRKLGRVFNEIVLPRISALEKSESLITQNNGEQGIAEYEYRTRHGQSFTFAADVYPVDGEVRSPILRYLFGAWLFSYYNEHDEPFTIIGRNKAVIEGLKQDQELLRDIGITHLVDLNVIEGKVIIIPTSDLIERYEAWNEQLEAAQINSGG